MAKTKSNKCKKNVAGMRRRAKRLRWMEQSSMLAGAVAIAAFAAAQQASAQSVVSVAPRANGTVSVQATQTATNGNATVSRGATRDQVTVTTPQAIINWQTFDTATIDTTTDYVNFLPAGTELLFAGTGGDYTVLNRIFSTPNASGTYRGIAFQGAVTSRLSDTGPVGGNIWFYSPGGILVSGSSAFNVGSLVLTTSDLATIDAGGSQLNFGGVSQTDSSIIVQDGAAINAVNEGSYVAMFAPRVEQGGTVNVNGSAAYVGAETGQLTINSGLFDIAISVGSEDANGVVHTGTTTGAASQDTYDSDGNLVNSDPQAIYLVAVPKNDAITMLVGGDIGYQPAISAEKGRNGDIFLVAGADVETNGGSNRSSVTIQTANEVAGGRIAFTGGNIAANLTAIASSDIDLILANGNILASGRDVNDDYRLDLTAGETINLEVTTGSAIDIVGDLLLRAGADPAVGGDINLSVSGDPLGALDNGTLNVGGNLVLNANARGRDDFFTFRNNGNTGIGEDAVGGDITLSLTDGGLIAVGGRLTLDTSAQGGKGETENGTATAGDIALSIDSGASLTVAGTTNLNAGTLTADSGKRGGNGLGLIGADSTGGDVTLDLAGGSIDLAGLTITTQGNASIGDDDSAPQEYRGSAGDVTINVTGGTHTIGGLTIASSSLASNFTGSNTDEQVERAQVAINVANLDTSLTINGSLNVDTSTRGRLVSSTDPAVSLSIANTGTSGGLTVTNSINFDTSANSGLADTLTRGGGVDILVDNGNLNFGDLDIDSTAYSGFGTGSSTSVNPEFQGGDVTLTVQNSASMTGGDINISAGGYGADVAEAIGTGGDITILVDDASLDSSGFADLDAAGIGGPGSSGAGIGGDVTFTLRGASGFMSFGSLFVTAEGIFTFISGGSDFFGSLGDGGTGVGGNVLFNIEDGILNAGSVTVSSDGIGDPIFFGEEASPPGKKDKVPANGLISAFQSQIDIASAAAIGVSGGPSTNGGDGTGGDVTFNLTGGTANLASLTVSADGIGGDGGSGSVRDNSVAGNGGTGTGGTATFNANAGALNVTGTLRVSADGNGRFSGGRGGFGSGVDGGQGGAGIGGTAIFNLEGTSSVSAGSLIVSADGFGSRGGTSSRGTTSSGTVVDAGVGGAGGDGTAGNAIFNHTSGALTVGSLEVRADGIGGAGADSFGLSTGLATNDGGAGGNGFGGNATLNLNQNDPSNPTYLVYARATGGSGGSGLNGGDGGDAEGGTAQLLANNVAVTLQSAIVNSTGTGGTSGFVDGENGNGGAGGSGTGGTSRITVSGSSGQLSSLAAIIVTSDGLGAAGGDAPTNPGNVSPSGTGGAGGTGTGGEIDISAVGGAQFDFTSGGSTSAQGIGGAGGAGGDAPTFTAGAGGVAGSGNGGTISLAAAGGSTLNLDSGGSQSEINANGTGGVGGTGAPAGAGGAATGGTVELRVDGVGSSMTAVDGLIANTSGIGGMGGTGVAGNSSNDGTQGGAGGDGQGGTTRLSIAGAGATLAVDPNIFQLNAEGVGGIGGTGGANLAGGVAGNGGVGGDGTGGAVELQAESGSTMDLTPGVSASSSPYILASSGTGGAGGTGGSIDMVSGGTAGDGGDGGNGIGGSPTLRAIGGTITGADLILRATGTGGVGGIGGDDGTTVSGNTGNGGDGQGGNPIMEIQDGSPGILTFNNVSIFANGAAGTGTLAGTTLGGRVDINDASPDPLGLMDFASLRVEAIGDAAAPDGGFFMLGGSGPTTIAGGVSVNVAGDIVYSFDGDGQLVAGGGVTLNAGGDIIVTHINNGAATVSIDAAGPFYATSGGSFSSGSGSFIATDGEMIISAGGDITADDLVAVPFINLTAGGSVVLNNALASGPQGSANLSGIIIDAGLVAAGAVFYDPSANVMITGNVDSYQDIQITAGGSTTFAAGSQTLADNALIVRTGDDIIVGAGASVTAAANPVDSIDLVDPFASGPNLQLLAGDVDNLLSIPLTPFASVVIDGELVSGDAATIITANAVDALDGTINAASLAVDINNAPANGIAPGDDNGLLSSNCVEGNVCIGNVLATNIIEIGQASNNDVIQLFVEQGTVSAREISIATRRDIVMGTNGIATQLDATDLFSLESSQGNIDLRDANVASDQILINAAGDLTGSASLNSTNDIGITVGGGIAAANIVSGGQLTTVANVGGPLEASYIVPGSMNVGQLDIGNGPVNISAGGDLTFGEIIVAAQDITLTTPGSISLGNADTAANITLDGGVLDVGTLFASDSISLLSGGDANLVAANAGNELDIDAQGNVSFLSTIAGSDLTINAGGAINGGDLDADGSISLDGSLVAIGNATATDISIVSGSDIFFNLLSSPNSISLTAANGVIGDNGGPGDIDSDGDVTLSALAIALNEIVAGGSVSTIATDGNLNFASILSDGDIVMDASGNIAVDHAESTGNFTATSGLSFATGLNSIITGGNIVITSLGPVDLGNSQAGGFIDVEGTQIDFVTLIADQFIELSTIAPSAVASGTGDIIGMSMTAGTGASSFTTTDGDILISGTVSSDGDLSMDAVGGLITLGDAANIVGDLSIAATGPVTMADGTAGGILDIESDASVTAGALQSGADLSVAANGGAFTGTTLQSTGDMSVTAAGDIAFNSANSGPNLSLVTTNGGAVSFSSAAATSSITVSSDGTITADTIDARGAGGTGAIDLDAQGDVTIGSLLGTNADILVANANLRIENDVDLGGQLVASANDVFVRSTHDLEVAAESTNGAVDIETAGALSTVGISATGDVRLVSTGSAATINAALSGSPAMGASSGGNILISAATDVIVNSDVTATGSLTILAGGTFDLNAAAIGATINLTSADIDIDSTGSLGRSDLTNFIAISTPDDMLIGGAGGTTGLFELDNDEFSRVHSGGDIEISSVSGAVELADLNIAVNNVAAGVLGGNIGSVGALSIFSVSGMDVTGEVVMRDANVDNALRLLTEGDLFVDASTGLLEIQEDIGVYTGTLDLSANNVFVMTTAALSDIAGQTIEDIDTRLANNDGVDNADGLLRAGVGFVTAQDAFLVQNTAAGTDFDDRRGFTFDSLSVESIDPGSAMAVVINGIVAGQTGLDAISATDFSAASLDPLSTMNGCLIADPASCAASPPVNPPVTPPVVTPPVTPPVNPHVPHCHNNCHDEGGPGPVQNIIEHLEEDDPIEHFHHDDLIGLLIELRDPPDYDAEPLIDDPVTGAGNEDLWTSGEDSCAEGAESCPA